MNITIPTLPLTYIEQPIIDNITDDDDHNISSVVEVLETPRQRRGSRSSSEMAAPPSARQSSVGEALRRINSPRPVANSINHKTNSGNTSCSPVIIPQPTTKDSDNHSNTTNNSNEEKQNIQNTNETKHSNTSILTSTSIRHLVQIIDTSTSKQSS